MEMRYEGGPGSVSPMGGEAAGTKPILPSVVNALRIAPMPSPAGVSDYPLGINAETGPHSIGLPIAWPIQSPPFEWGVSLPLIFYAYSILSLKMRPLILLLLKKGLFHAVFSRKDRFK